MAKILVVDDEEHIVEMLRMRLEVHGYDVIAAYDGQEGLRLAKTESPDLIILDVMLPKMDGYSVCRMLKYDNKYSSIPIIMLTARAQQQDQNIGEKTGADIYMIKPFDPKELMGKVEEFLNR